MRCLGQTLNVPWSEIPPGWSLIDPWEVMVNLPTIY